MLVQTAAILPLGLAPPLRLLKLSAAADAMQTITTKKIEKVVASGNTRLLNANRLAFTKCLSDLLCFEIELLANVDFIVHKVKYVTML